MERESINNSIEELHKKKAILEINILEEQIKSQIKIIKPVEKIRQNWLLIIAVITPCTGLLTWFNSYTQQLNSIRKNEIANFHQIITNAVNSESGIERSVNVGALSSYWRSDIMDEDNLNFLSNTLASIIVNDTLKFVGLSTAETLGNAIKEGDEFKHKDRIRNLLYGSASEYEYGIISKLYSFIEGDSNYFYEQRRNALNEAVRKNWEFLEGSYFKGADMTGIKLYDTRLQNCNFSYCNLSKADLFNSNLTDVIFEEAKFDRANIKGVLANENFIHYAKSMGAVEMEPDEWYKWVKE